MDLHRPESQVTALRLLAEAEEDTKIIAGGTALVLMMRHGLVFPDGLISLERVPELDHIVLEADQVRIGALVTLRGVERSRVLRTELPTLAAATGMVANHRVRNRATVGGNVSEADYASDPPAVLTTLGCRVRIASVRGVRTLPIREFLIDYYTSALEADEMVTEILVSRPARSARTTYLKYVTRTEEDRPCVGVAALLDLDESGRCREVRVAISGATSTPFVLEDLTAACVGRPADEGMWKEVGEAYGAAIQPIGDNRGSSAYRKAVTAELVERALGSLVESRDNGAVRL